MKKSILIASLTTLIVLGLTVVSTINLNVTKASVDVKGIIYSDTKWTMANSPYTLTGPVAVNVGVTLTIEAGVTVNLDSHYIQVNGTLRIMGDNANKVQLSDGQLAFTSVSNGWNEQTGSGNIIDNAVLNQTSISCVNSLKISSSTIDGVVAVGASSVISNNIIVGRHFPRSFPYEALPYALTAGTASVISGNTIYGKEDQGLAMGMYYYHNYAISVNGNSSVISDNTITGDVNASVGEISYNTLTGGVNGGSLSTISFNTITSGVHGTSLVITNNTITGNNPLYDPNSQTSSSVSAISVGGDSSVISNNTITSDKGYGITISEGYTYVLNNKIAKSIAGIRVAGDSAIQGNLMTNNNIGIAVGMITSSGYYLGSGNSTIRHNTFTNNWAAISSSEEGGSATIERNQFFNNTNGINVASQVTVQNNTIANSSIGIKIKNTAATINYNNIQDNSQNSVYLEDTPQDVDAANNWWGTTDEQLIKQKILDFDSDFSLGKVNIVPILAAPNPEATPDPNAALPVTPTQSPSPSPATINSENGLVIIGAAVIAITLGAGLGLLVYLMKRK